MNETITGLTTSAHGASESSEQQLRSMRDDIRPSQDELLTLQNEATASPEQHKLMQLKQMASDFSAADDTSSKRNIQQGGLPDTLKSGLEHLSGYAMDDVQVHYNSSKPAQLNAYAYAQGNQIHLGPGQEKHLPHEAWHVVQQKQGRVQPTRQFKGITAINDDATLEREADVMGERAMRINTLNTQQKSTHLLKKKQVSNDAAIQGKFTLGGITFNSSDDVKANTDRFKSLFESAGYTTIIFSKLFAKTNELADKTDDLGVFTKESFLTNIHQVAAGEIKEVSSEPFKNFNKLPRELRDLLGSTGLDFKAEVLEAIIFLESLYQQVEDDEDLKYIREQDALLEENVREMFREESLANSKSFFNPSPFGGAGNITTFRNYYSEFTKILLKLKKSFPMNEGGFSAKARAHDMPTSPIDKADHHKDNRYLRNITINGKSISSSYNVYKKDSVSVAETAGPLTSNSEMNDFADTHTKAETIAEFETRLNTPLNIFQPVIYTNTPVGVGRNGGQAVNMLNTNATAYAAWAEIPNYQTKKWEWLHVRASSLGGVTDGTNLVVGTRDTNTQMMPFESNIRTMATLIGRSNKSRYKDLKVDFNTSLSDPTARHKVPEIEISWEARKADFAPVATPDFKGTARFDPLNTSSSISKFEVDILSKELKGGREELEKAIG